jgi:uncharacterized protein
MIQWTGGTILTETIMDRILLLLAILGILTILCQWYVIISIRSYLFQRYEAMTRRVAYPILIALGILNLAAVTFAVDSAWFRPDTFARKAAAVTFFSYLGIVLILCLFFLALGILCHILNFRMTTKGSVTRAPGPRASVAASQRGCVTSVCSRPPDEAVTHESSGTGARDCLEQWPAESEKAADFGVVEGPRSGAPSLSRRNFLKWSAAAGLATTLGYGADGVVEAYSTPLIEEFDLFHPRLRGLAETITLIQITDFHFGLFCGTTELDRLVRLVNSIEADAVVFTGDMFHSPLSPVERAIPIIRKLRQRRLGNFAVMGNHDFYAGEIRSVQGFKDGGLKLLRNQWVTFQVRDTDIHLGGIDDPMVNWVWGKEFPGFSRFLGEAPKTRGFRILLSHRPAVFPLASRVGMDFVMAGHTHGGQIILPGPGVDRGFSLARVVSPFTHGWYAREESRMYLNRGVGLTFIPWRINCPPEIAVIHLSGFDRGETEVRRRGGQSTAGGLNRG